MNEMETVKLIEALKDVLRPPERPQHHDLLKTIKVLGEMGIITPPTQNDEAAVIEKLKAMKDSLGLKYAHEVARDDSMMDQVEKFEDLLSAIKPFIPPKEKPSAVPALLAAVGQFGLPLIGILRDLTALGELRMQQRFLASSMRSPSPPREGAKIKEENGEGEGETMDDNKIVGSGADWCESMGIKVR